VSDPTTPEVLRAIRSPALATAIVERDAAVAEWKDARAEEHRLAGPYSKAVVRRQKLFAQKVNANAKVNRLRQRERTPGVIRRSMTLHFIKYPSHLDSVIAQDCVFCTTAFVDLPIGNSAIKDAGNLAVKNEECREKFRHYLVKKGDAGTLDEAEQIIQRKEARP
jgi:hypothetical protein